MNITNNQIGRCAAFFTVIMSFSFIDQIKLNLHGVKGSILMFSMMFCNFALWTLYGIQTQQRQIWITNGLGFVFAIILIVTYYF